MPARSWRRSTARSGPERLLDLLLRAGPYGDRFGEDPDGPDAGAARGRAARHRPRPAASRGCPEALRTAERQDRAGAGADRRRRRPAARGAGARAPTAQMVLIGRRQLRSNNSWMHNVPRWSAARSAAPRTSTPTTPSASASTDGEPARVTSRAGEVEIPVEVTDAVMPGVVSIPHGWGHDARRRRAQRRPRARRRRTATCSPTRT